MHCGTVAVMRLEARLRHGVEIRPGDLCEAGKVCRLLCPDHCIALVVDVGGHSVTGGVVGSTRERLDGTFVQITLKAPVHMGTVQAVLDRNIQKHAGVGEVGALCHEERHQASLHCCGAGRADPLPSPIDQAVGIERVGLPGDELGVKGHAFRRSSLSDLIDRPKVDVR